MGPTHVTSVQGALDFLIIIQCSSGSFDETFSHDFSGSPTLLKSKVCRQSLTTTDEPMSQISDPIPNAESDDLTIYPSSSPTSYFQSPISYPDALTVTAQYASSLTDRRAVYLKVLPPSWQEGFYSDESSDSEMISYLTRPPVTLEGPKYGS